MSLGKKTNTCSDRDYDHPHPLALNVRLLKY